MSCVIGLLLILVTMAPALLRAAAPDVKISDNRRFLVDQNGAPFFWLGDTAWELFHRLNREEADRYLENRARLGFTVVQAVALAELDGLHAPNPYGHTPLIDDDPTRPEHSRRSPERLLGPCRLHCPESEFAGYRRRLSADLG